MTSEEKVDYLEVDNPIPGQNYACISFVSPEKLLKSKELFLYSKFISQRCGELEKKLDEIIENSSDELRNSIKDKIVSELHSLMKISYDKFDSIFEDFKYKFHNDLEQQFNKISNGKTSIRGVKIRGVYDSYQQAEQRAKLLQRTDRSFHVFVGQVGYWLPWDPCADNVENEEYLEDELNTMMQKYKENEVSRDILYEEEKRDKMKASMKKKLEEDKKNKESLQDEDPWMKAKFDGAEESLEPVVEELPDDDPADTSVDTPVDTSVDTPADTSVDASTETPENASVVEKEI